MPLGRCLSRVAVAAKCVGLLLLEYLLEYPFGGQLYQGTQQLLTALGFTLSLQTLGDLLRLPGAWRYLPRQTGGSFSWVVK
jgi:hypothetical protein